MPCYGYTYCHLCSLPIDEDASHRSSLHDQINNVSIDWLKKSVALVNWYDIVKIVCSRDRNFNIGTTDREKMQRYIKDVCLDSCFVVHTTTEPDLCGQVSITPTGRTEILEYFTKLKEYVYFPILNTYIDKVIDFITNSDGPYTAGVDRYIFHETCYNILSQEIIIDQDIYDIYTHKKIPDTEISKYRSDFYTKSYKDLEPQLKSQFDQYFVDQQLEQYTKILQNGEQWLLDDPTIGEKQKTV